MKRILLLLFCLLLLSSDCYAIRFSQPFITGFSVIMTQAGGGFIVENATENNGDYYKRRYNGKTLIYDGKNMKSLRYGKGVARWGSGKDALFAHYNFYSKDSNVYFGDRNKKNTVSIKSMIFSENIFKIETNEGITFYMIQTSYDLPDETWWTLIGRKTDGVWVKYFDSDSVTEKYFGKSALAGHGYVWRGQSICCDNFRVSNNIIAIEYSRFHKSSGQKGNFIKEGEFRFKWDDKAQWFGVENIVY